MKVYVAKYAFESMYRENHWWDLLTEETHIFLLLEDAREFVESKQPKNEWDSDDEWKWSDDENPWCYESTNPDDTPFEVWMITEVEVK